jgi:putative ABC transport system ATP-binding protein/lipoprotein-releasing system ATP-binding protein
MVFQTPSLLAPLTAVENVELPLLLQSMDATRAREMALDALLRIDLGEVANKLPEELSGGQAQRVAMARSIATRPRLILADEPSGQLDHSTAQHLFDGLLAALEGTGTALLVATHDQGIAKRMSITWHIQHGVLEKLPVANVVSDGRVAVGTDIPGGVIRG